MKRRDPTAVRESDHLTDRYSSEELQAGNSLLQMLLLFIGVIISARFTPAFRIAKIRQRRSHSETLARPDENRPGQTCRPRRGLEE